MNTKTLSLSIAIASLAISGFASASNQIPAPGKARCEQLIAQFDAAKAAHANDPKAAQATAARNRGAENCKAGEYVMGENALTDALKDIGVTPSSPKS